MADPLNLTQSYGFNQPLVTGAPRPIVADRIPTGADRAVLGTIWIARNVSTAYIATSVSNNVTTWNIAASAAGVFTDITVTPGSIVVTNGNITANVGNITAGGTLTAGGNIQTLLGSISLLGAGDINVTNGDVILGNGNIDIQNQDNSADDAHINFFKTRMAGVITSGDGLGTITFQGHDGTDFKIASQILSVSSGTIANDRIASNLEFYTSPDAVSANPIQRMIIGPTGQVTINTPDVGSGDPALQANGPIDCTDEIVGTILRASADPGGLPGHNSFGNGSDLTANGAGTFTIKSKSANNLDSSGFIKIYIGNTDYYIPVFSSPSP